MDVIASALRTHRVEVASLVSFYSFIKDKPNGRIVIGCAILSSIACRGWAMWRSFQRELGIRMGGHTADGKIGLEWTSCIGMLTRRRRRWLTMLLHSPVTDTAKQIVEDLRNTWTRSVW